jgi:hypothetical protein
MKMTATIAMGLAAALAAQAQATRDSAQASIQGTVIGENGQPLAGATVYAFSDMRKQIETTSDANGNYMLPKTPTGVVYIDAYKESDGYPNNFFAFHKAINEEVHKIDVAPGAHIQGFVIELGPRAATLHLEITQSSGAPVAGGVGVAFTRDDQPSPYSTSLRPGHTTLVPSLVPVRFSVTVPGYKTWESQAITGRPGETLNVVVNLERQ